MNEEITVEEEPEVIEDQPVLVLPGHLFFVDRIELPTALENSEIDDFAELSLEGIAPFPIEQLYWGFIYSESASSILLYAAYKERIKAFGFKDLDSYVWALPDFAILSGAYFPEPTTAVLLSEDGHSQVTYDAGEALPRQIISSTSTSEFKESSQNEPLLRLLLESIKLSEQGIPTFNLRAQEDSNDDIPGNWKQLCPTEDDLWRADIRDASFKKAERNARKLTKWITRATVYAALFALLLLMMEGALILGDFWLETKNATIAEQAPEVRRIEDKQSLMNKLDQVAQNELRPIAILEALNKSRPESIYFTSTEVEGQNTITVDGIANTVSGFNAYTTALQASGNFELLRDKSLTRGGKTTFEVTLNYIHNKAIATPEEEKEEKEEEG